MSDTKKTPVDGMGGTPLPPVEWKSLHPHPCPKCGETDIEVTTMGFIGSHNPNKAKCLSCGWEGMVREMIDAEIMTMLRSEDSTKVAEALGLLYPDVSVALVRCTALGKMSFAVPDGVNLPSLFTALQFACQRLGGLMGIELHWVKVPGEDNRLVLPGNGPPLRG